MNSTAHASNRIEANIKAQQLSGAAMTVVGAAVLLLLPFFWTHLTGSQRGIAIIVGAAAFLTGRRNLARARSRRYGIAIEKAWTAKAVLALRAKGLDTRSNVLMRGRGDIDLVASRAGAPVPIEIKSFHHWESHSDRCKKAVCQTLRQMDYLHARQAFIWLPVAKAWWWRRIFGYRAGQVRIVVGSSAKLARAVNRKLG